MLFGDDDRAQADRLDSLSGHGDAFNGAGDQGAGGGFSAGGGGSGGGSGGGAILIEPGGEAPISLRDAAESRYLNYALSVITSRALPDVRDGLKPVQRRILFTMWQQGLRADAKHRKCATVCGAVMGAYHPHGDQAIYDALVRMAQPWVMRVLLVEGSGNFGSLDGDPPAAYRYTECRLAPAAAELLDDIGRGTVHFRPNYYGTKSEPVVLPSRLPNLLINGSTGIAVGMATNIPPHNAEEVGRALLRLLDNPELSAAELSRTVRGPDFPTGGQIVSTRAEIAEVYKTGQGAIKLRGTWTLEQPQGRGGGPVIVIDSIPYGVNKATLVEAIAQIVNGRKMPLIADVRDVSAEDVRIELDLKKGSDATDAAKVAAYLYKHTAFQSNFHVNLTCLVPTENPEVGRPQRCDLRELLRYFLNFRLDVVTRRLAHELAALEKRIHTLEGFAIAFDVLDEIIKIIRASEGKADAADKIMAKFGVEKLGAGKGLDAEQTDAILELKLYRLAKLEIKVILDELKEKRARAGEIRKLLDDQTAAGRWGIVRAEIEAWVDAYRKADAPGGIDGRRLTQIADTEGEVEFSAEDFIVAEDCHVLLTTDGWIKRQKEIADPGRTRLREGDAVLTCQAGSTTAVFALFSNFGVCYSARIIDIPATTGFGEPVQKLFKLKDGERIIAAMSLDPRVIGELVEPDARHYPPTHGLAATGDGYALRFSLAPFAEPSTKAGRKYAKPATARGVQVVGVEAVHGDETLLALSVNARALLCPVDEVNYLTGPGKGVILMKLDAADQLLGVKASRGDRDLLRAETMRGGEQTVSTAKYEVTSRGGKGREIVKRGRIKRIVPEPPTAPPPLEQ